MLLGVQTLQSSFLHDHVQHQVDCVLCHIDSHDQGIVSLADLTLREAQIFHLSAFADQEYFSCLYPSYQGRSPPRFYS